MRWADKKDLKKTRGWIYDSWDQRDKRYAEFWEMVIGLRAVNPWPWDGELPFRRKTWAQLLAPMYDISKQLDPNNPRRATQWIYRSYREMDGTKANAAFQSEFGRLLQKGDTVAKSILVDSKTEQNRFIPLADPNDPRDKFDTGKFTMGAPANEEPLWDTKIKSRIQDNPQHTVDLSPFRMHRHCVTNRQFELFAPSHKANREFETVNSKGKKKRNTNNHPVVNVDWYDAWCFAQWIGEQDIAGQRYQIGLPAEAQWEYALSLIHI